MCSHASAFALNAWLCGATPTNTGFATVSHRSPPKCAKCTIIWYAIFRTILKPKTISHAIVGICDSIASQGSQ